MPRHFSDEFARLEVPQVDTFVTTASCDFALILADRDRLQIAGVANVLLSRFTRRQVPQPCRLVLGTGNKLIAVARKTKRRDFRTVPRQ